LWKGFHDLHQLGFIDRIPRLVGVQAEGCQPVKRAWETGQPVEKITPRTCADSIAVGHPRDALKALRAVRDSNGYMVAVSDDQILQAMGNLARKTGVFGEPAGVTGFAGLLEARSQGLVQDGEMAVVVVTGSGLKDVDSALRAAPKPREIEPTLEAVAQEMERGL
jgi:threonine synthase